VYGVNALLGKWLLERMGDGGGGGAEKGLMRGWTLMDYYSEPAQVVPLLVECNFLGGRIQNGEEGLLMV